MKSTLIVVEGPTAAGKTTLVEGIRSFKHFPIVHMPKDETLDVTQHYIDAATLGMVPIVGSSRIMDRWAYSNHVYANVLQNQLKADLWRVERAVLDFFDEVCTIWLNGTPEVLLERAKARTGKPLMPELDDPHTWDEMCYEFDLEYETCGLRKLMLDSTILNPDELLIQTLEFIR